jgi:hypothetical protein
MAGVQFKLMVSWALVADVYFLPPQTQRDGESAAEFAQRVQVRARGSLPAHMPNRTAAGPLSAALLPRWLTPKVTGRTLRQTGALYGMCTAYESAVNIPYNAPVCLKIRPLNFGVSRLGCIYVCLHSYQHHCCG